ncbi:MAG: glycosyltransferase [Candidatus Omnitrophica bacterium]|nr:glycosyltransferase [Candidatus Omnitrophota bacterium]
MPRVSVVIPVYNASQCLPAAMKSVLTQSYQDFEVVVVDDGSTDDTKTIIMTFASTYPEKIKYVYQKNSGVSVARNTGITNAAGQWIAFLDSDDSWASDHLESLVKAMEADNDTALVHSDIVKIKDNGDEIGRPVRNTALLSGKIFRSLFLREADIATSTVLFKKECWEDVGSFDEHLTYLGCEDRDFWLRLARKYNVRYVDKASVYYRVSDHSMSRSHAKMLEARLYVINKYSSDCLEARELKRLALAKVYRDLGDQALMKQDFVSAKKWYIKSLGFSMFTRWAWINLLKAFLKIRIPYVD